MGRNVQPQADEPTERKWLRLAAGIFIGVFIQRKLAGKPEPPARTRSVRVAAEQAPPAPREQPGAADTPAALYVPAATPVPTQSLRSAQVASVLLAAIAMQCNIWLPFVTQWLPAISRALPGAGSAAWAIVAMVLALNVGLLEAAIKIVAALTGAQKPPAAAAGSATAGSVRVIPPALAASMERVIDSHRRATQSSRPSGELQPVAARGAPQLESPRPADRDIWQEVATGDEVAMRESFRRAARAIGPDIETPLVLGQGDAKVRPDLGVLPFTAEAMSAVWLKDRERSDSMAPVCEVAQLNGLLRRAVNLMRGVDIKMTPLGIGIGAISVIPVLKIFERYQFDGTITKFGRRDMRRGKTFGRAEPTPNGVMCIMRWHEPLAGWGVELYKLTSPDELFVESEICIHGQLVKWNTIYVRK